ncbi:hypothetical protein FQA39_LY05988 [Lamprigera yunnana]|nr:hypothetical protein FQA39_LY05988 [Lamprigera yunnana]
MGEYKKKKVRFVRLWEDMETDSEPEGSGNEEDHLIVEDDSATEQEISEDEAPIQLDEELKKKTKNRKVWRTNSNQLGATETTLERVEVGGLRWFGKFMRLPGNP